MTAMPVVVNLIGGLRHNECEKIKVTKTCRTRTQMLTNLKKKKKKKRRRLIAAFLTFLHVKRNVNTIETQIQIANCESWCWWTPHPQSLYQIETRIYKASFLDKWNRMKPSLFNVQHLRGSNDSRNITKCNKMRSILLLLLSVWNITLPSIE